MSDAQRTRLGYMCIRLSRSTQPSCHDPPARQNRPWLRGAHQSQSSEVGHLKRRRPTRVNSTLAPSVPYGGSERCGIKPKAKVRLPAAERALVVEFSAVGACAWAGPHQA